MCDYRSGEVVQAIKTLTRSIKARPTHRMTDQSGEVVHKPAAGALMARAQLHAQQENYQGALADFVQVCIMFCCTVCVHTAWFKIGHVGVGGVIQATVRVMYVFYRSWEYRQKVQRRHWGKQRHFLN